MFDPSMRGESSTFRKHLLAWFDAQKRMLPWRIEPSLYKTVVSEFMLQQTQVATVLPYFKKWMAVFPDFEALAEAEEARVVKQWEGLGYYTRARNLHKLARSIVKDGIPRSSGEWKNRPGIGPYTAAAISSIAQGLPEPVIDGNVIRVLSRLHNDPTPVSSAAGAHNRFRPVAAALIDPQRPGDFNEALMELGATVCRKAKPACLLCPVEAYCAAAFHGTENRIPVIVRRQTRKRVLHRLWLLQGKQLLLHRHPSDATRLAGLTELPEIRDNPGGKPLLSRSRGISSERVREHIHCLGPSHPFAREVLDSPDSLWVPLDQLPRITLSAPHKRWIRELLESA